MDLSLGKNIELLQTNLNCASIITPITKEESRVFCQSVRWQLALFKVGADLHRAHIAGLPR